MPLKFTPYLPRSYCYYGCALFFCSSLFLANGCTSLAPTTAGAPTNTAQAQPNTKVLPIATHLALNSAVSDSSEIALNLPLQNTSIALFYNQLTYDSLLAYADHLRTLNATELSTEIKQLEAQVQVQAPYAEQKNLPYALALMQTRTVANLKKAHQLLLYFVAQPEPDTEPLHPLANLLIDGIASQLRLQEVLDQQAQQLRENQRRLDAQAERLKAIRAIERSLTLPKAQKSDLTRNLPIP